MKRLLLQALFLSIPFLATAQRLAILSSKSYGGNHGAGVSGLRARTADGGFIIGVGGRSTVANFNLGNCQTPTDSAVSIYMKYNADGTVMEWQKCFLNSPFAISYVFPLQDGGFIEVSGQNAKWAIRKEDASGGIVWYKDYGGLPSTGGVSLRNVIATADGGYLFGGESNTATGDVGMHYGAQMSSDIWLLKLDSLGNKVWSKVIGGSSEDRFSGLCLGPNGGCYVFGSTISSDFDCTGQHAPNTLYGDGLVVRLDSMGNTLWHHCIGGTANDGFGEGVEDGSGGLVISGGTYSIDGDVHHAIGNGDYWAVRMDSSGSIVWENCYGSTGNEYAYMICRSSTGEYWLSGVTHSQGGQVDTVYKYTKDNWIVRIDAQGNFKGQRVLGPLGGSGPTGIIALTNGIVMATGIYDIPGSIFPPLYAPSDDNTNGYLVRLAPWPVGITEVTPHESTILSAYPNPASGLIQVSVAGVGAQPGELTMSDMAGRLISHKSITPNQKLSLSVSGLSAGIYLYLTRIV